MKRINLTQDDLHRLISLQRQLMRDTEQLHMLFDLAQGTASVPTDTLRVQNSLPPSGNKFAVAAADLSEVMEQEEAELEELLATSFDDDCFSLAVIRPMDAG